MDHTVSIIIIGRNEELIIGKCIDAAVNAARQIGGAEMIYVDSHSTDKTVSIAQSYGFAVIPLSPDLRMSPSAGRYCGSLHAKGDLIMFLDADTIIHPDFLPKAVSFFERDSMIAGINGYIEDLTETGEEVFDIDERFGEVTDVKWLRGPACFYRRSALIDVGSFNPELATEEEAELGLRLIRRGWELKLIPEMMATHTRCHHTHSLASMLSTFRRDIRSRRLGEITRTVAYSFRAGNGFAFCWLRLKTTILFLAWLTLIAIFLLLSDAFPTHIIAAMIFSLGVLMILAKKRSVSQTLLFVPAKVLCLMDLLFGVPVIIAGGAFAILVKDREIKPRTRLSFLRFK